MAAIQLRVYKLLLNLLETIKIKVIILKDFALSFLYPRTTVTTKIFVGNIIGKALLFQVVVTNRT